jgi:hypothetical protein
LEDIQRNFLLNNNHQNESATPEPIRKSGQNSKYDDYDYVEGDVTGYAVPYPPPYVPTPNQNREPYYPTAPTAGSKTGYYHTGSETWPSYEEKGMMKGLGLKDLFEIALTALAFLSFGMFILQVIMCITMTKNDNMLMMPVEVDETEVIEEEGEIRRVRRSPDEISNLRQFNEISRRVLRSIEAVSLVKKGHESCLPKVICENNQFSRTLVDKQKIWMPIWGLGMSWLSSRVTREKAPSAAILDCLRASVIGLGKGDCEKIYPDCREKLFDI